MPSSTRPEGPFLPPPSSASVIQPGYPDHSTLTVPRLVHELGFQHFNIVIAPVMLVFFFAQKAFVEGVTLTGVKG